METATYEALRQFADYFAERNLEATGDWRAAVEYCQAVLESALSASPSPAVGELTDEQIADCWYRVGGTRNGYVPFARAVIAAISRPPVQHKA